jgi:hypothetical protein
MSATPMYDSYKEIIWIANSDELERQAVADKISDVFDKNGNFSEQTSDAGEITKAGNRLNGNL